MSEFLLYVDQSTVRDGALNDLEPAMAELANFVADNEPDILAYDVYFSPDGNRMTVVHMHETEETLEVHMNVAGGKFPPIGEYIDLESIDVYGPLSGNLEQRLREKAEQLGTGRVTVHERHRGVNRLVNGRDESTRKRQPATDE